MAPRTKMTIKIYTPLWKLFNEQIKRMPISRDHFLNMTLKAETKRLSEAMNGRRLSTRANRFISDSLMSLKTITTVNIGLDRDVSSDLNAIVKNSHMVRDAFFNRLILFLRSSDKFLESLDLPKLENGRVGRNFGDSIAKPVSPLKALDDIFVDPLWYLHRAAEEIWHTNLYLLDFPASAWDGFSCWIDDETVPGTRRNKLHQLSLLELVKDMEDLKAVESIKPRSSGRQ
jgi:hypothetical protein